MAAPTTVQRPAGPDDTHSTANKLATDQHTVKPPSPVSSVKAPSSPDAVKQPSPEPVKTSTVSVEPTLEPTKPSAILIRPPSPPTTPIPTAVPSTPLPRSSLKRKRNAMDVDSPTSPVKRSVTFSDVVEEVEDESTTKDVRKEVLFALESHAEGENEGFDTLKGYFTNESNDAKPSPDSLRLYLAALTSNIGMLRRSCAPLIHSILESDWLGQDDAYVSTYVRLLGGLVSSHGFWLREVLQALVEKFDGRTTLLPPHFAPSTAVLQDRLHSAIQYILRLVPSASKVLGDSTSGRVSLLALRFPHQADTRCAHVRYVQNLLRLTEYAPELQGEVLTLVTERVVKIDVQAQVDFEDLADEIGDELLTNLPAFNEGSLEDEDSDNESEMEDDDMDPEATKMKSITSSMATLDAIMNLLFEYYSFAFSNPSSTTALSASRMLLSHFRSLILPTYRSRHTQFLLFHFMQSSPAMVDDFLGTCVSLVLDRSRPRILRQSAATYLASFVARGLHVPRDMTKDVFAFIADQLTDLRNQYEPTCLGPNPTMYDTYYALVQAMLYIFCFRWRDLAVEDDSSETLSPPGLPGLNAAMMEDDWENVQFPSDVKEALANNVFSPLNPLRLVAPAIAAEFVDTARRLRVLYAHHVLATNRRVRVLTDGAHHGSGVSTPTRPGGSNGANTPVRGNTTPLASAGGGRGDLASAHTFKRDDARVCLDGYFPFDPYRLPASKHWVDSDYREWEGLGDDEESESDEEESDEDMQ